MSVSRSRSRHRSPSLGSHRARVSGLGARSAQDVDRWDGRDRERDRHSPGDSHDQDSDDNDSDDSDQFRCS